MAETNGLTLTVPSILPVHTLTPTPLGPPARPTAQHTTAKACPSNFAHGSTIAFDTLGSWSTNRAILHTYAVESSDVDTSIWLQGVNFRVRTDR